jgi:hypothetical protein
MPQYKQTLMCGQADWRVTIPVMLTGSDVAKALK